VGVYCINAARYLSGEEPTEVTATALTPPDDPRFREVPESVSFTLQFPSGVVAHCDCSFGTAENRQYRMIGEKGFVDMDPAFAYYGLRLKLNDGNGTQDLQFKPVNHFAAEMDHFSRCILDGTEPRTPGNEGLCDGGFNAFSTARRINRGTPATGESKFRLPKASALSEQLSKRSFA
jgi:predicted dehydrogenase